MIGIIVLSGAEVYSAGFCPTQLEIQNKSQSWQQRALAGMASQSTNINEVEALLKEQETYMNNLVPNCVQYFKTTPNAECRRMVGLTTGYMMLTKEKQASAKLQIMTAVAPLAQRCPAEYETIKLFLK